MPAYWLARSRVNNPDGYKLYADAAGGILAKYGGKVLARGGKFQIMEGSDHFGRFVAVEFPTFEDAVNCFESEEYKAAAANRRDGSGEVEVVIVEGA